MPKASGVSARATSTTAKKLLAPESTWSARPIDCALEGRVNRNSTRPRRTWQWLLTLGDSPSKSAGLWVQLSRQLAAPSAPSLTWTRSCTRQAACLSQTERERAPSVVVVVHDAGPRSSPTLRSCPCDRLRRSHQGLAEDTTEGQCCVGTVGGVGWAVAVVRESAASCTRQRGTARGETGRNSSLFFGALCLLHSLIRWHSLLVASISESSDCRSP